MSSIEQIVNKIVYHINKNDLIKKNDSILIAISGGSDSTALSLLMHNLKDELKIERIALIHFNHKLRGLESDRDETFCENFAEKFGLPFYFECLNEKALKGASAQAFYREKRYNFFQKIASLHNYNKIATAHTLNDVTETVLMRLFSGTGLDGLTGIPVIIGNIIRPVLNVTRAELELILKEYNQGFVLDSSNKSDKYLRNDVRLNLIPEIEKIFPAFNSAISRCINSLTLDNDFIDNEVNRVCNLIKTENNGEISFDSNEIKKYHPSLIFRIIKKIGEYYSILFSFTNISDIKDAIFKKTDGSKIIVSINNLIVKREYDKIIFSLKKNKNDLYFSVEINTGETKIWNNYKFSLQKKDKSDIEINFSNTMFFDAKSVELPFIIRSFENGDRIKTTVKGEGKKLKEIFINMKIPVFERKNIAVIESNNQVIGFFYKESAAEKIFRTAVNTYITDETEKVFCLNF